MSRLDIQTISSCVEINTIKEILYTKSFYTEYQPFISVETGAVIAYEALARFEHKGIYYPPDVVFETCHKDISLFFDLEIQMKRYQFKNRPDNSKLFINFDPHVFWNRAKVNLIFELFSKQCDFVIELIENSHRVVNSAKLLEIFNKCNYKFAIDDFFKESSMVSIFYLNKCDYLKLDYDMLKEVKKNRVFGNIINGIVKYAHESKKKVILEGVETKDDFELAKEYSIDMVQGFYFREQFIKKQL